MAEDRELWAVYLKERGWTVETIGDYGDQFWHDPDGQSKYDRLIWPAVKIQITRDADLLIGAYMRDERR